MGIFSMKKWSIVSLILVMVAGMFMMPAASLAEDTDDFTVEYYGKVDSTGEGDFSQSLGDGNFCAIKQGNGHVIVWSEDALSDTEKTVIEKMVKANDPSIKADDVFHFVTEKNFEGNAITGQTNWGIYTITEVNGEYVLTCAADKISHLDYGKYTRPIKEHGEWVPVSTSSDSCTGYGKTIGLKDTLVGNSWFVEQTLNAAGEYPLDLDIIAGNPKNGPNIVGTLTVNKETDGYKLNYKFEEQAKPADPVIGDTYTVVDIQDAHYNYSGSPVAINKAPGKNLILTDGVTFTPEVNDNGEFDLYAHFSIKVTTYQYQMVPDAE